MYIFFPFLLTFLLSFFIFCHLLFLFIIFRLASSCPFSPFSFFVYYLWFFLSSSFSFFSSSFSPLILLLSSRIVFISSLLPLFILLILFFFSFFFYINDTCRHLPITHKVNVERISRSQIIPSKYFFFLLSYYISNVTKMGKTPFNRTKNG